MALSDDLETEPPIPAGHVAARSRTRLRRCPGPSSGQVPAPRTGSHRRGGGSPAPRCRDRVGAVVVPSGRSGPCGRGCRRARGADAVAPRGPWTGPGGDGRTAHRRPGGPRGADRRRRRVSGLPAGFVQADGTASAQGWCRERATPCCSGRSGTECRRHLAGAAGRIRAARRRAIVGAGKVEPRTDGWAESALVSRPVDVIVVHRTSSGRSPARAGAGGLLSRCTAPAGTRRKSPGPASTTSPPPGPDSSRIRPETT